MQYFPYWFNVVPIKIQVGSTAEIDKLILKFTWKCKGFGIGKIILKKKNEVGEKNHTSQFLNLLQVCNKTVTGPMADI